MNRLSFAFLLIVALIFIGCDDDSNERDIKHYYNPVWSADGSLLIAAYEEAYGDPGAPRAPISDLAIHNTGTGEETIIHIKNGLDYKRYHIVPGNNYIAVLDESLEFYSFEGTLNGTYTVSTLGVSPVVACFSDNDNTFLWAAYKDGIVNVGQTTYGDEPWLAVNERILQTFPANSRPVDLIYGDEGFFLIALQEGKIFYYPLLGNLYGQYNYTPYPSTNAWKHRIDYVFKSGENIEYLYTLNDSGLYRINLTTSEGKLIVNGQAKYLVGFDVADSTDAAIFEVSSGDLWWARLDGDPITRILNSHRMGMFSPNGKNIASVALVRGQVDSLSVFNLYK